MAITAAQVKELREATGAGMMDCKKALMESNGDMDAAVEVLRKKGQAKAEKKASRIAAEGICLIATDGDQKAAVVEVNSETDFVAQNEKFRTYVAKVADQALKTDAKDIDAFMAEPWIEDGSKTVSEALVDMIAVIVFKTMGRTVSEAHEDIFRILWITKSRTVIAIMTVVTRTILSESRKITKDISIKNPITGVMYFTQALPFENLVNKTRTMNSTTVPATIAISAKATVKSSNNAGT